MPFFYTTYDLDFDIKQQLFNELSNDILRSWLQPRPSYWNKSEGTSSLVPRLSIGEWRRTWYTLIADPPTFPPGFLSQCVIMIFDCLQYLLIAKHNKNMKATMGDTTNTLLLLQVSTRLLWWPIRD